MGSGFFNKNALLITALLVVVPEVDIYLLRFVPLHLKRNTSYVILTERGNKVCALRRFRLRNSNAYVIPMNSRLAILLA